MPQIFRMGGYWIYFWTNESRPLEPIHVHISEGRPTENATKVWITESGKCLLQSNSSQIPERPLRNIMRTIEARSDEVIRKWTEYFGEVYYYC